LLARKRFPLQNGGHQEIDKHFIRSGTIVLALDMLIGLYMPQPSGGVSCDAVLL
jgi:hypothetical protein